MSLKTTCLLLALLLAGTFLLIALTEPEALPPHPYFAGEDFLVIAHRGGRGLGPESTLPLFRRAVELGVDVLEMDVRLSADSALVVLHDATVDRTTEGRGRADSLTLAQLQALDAGYDWTADGQTHPYRGQGIRIPTLAEVLQAFPAQRLNVEIKEDDARTACALCAELREGRMERLLDLGVEGIMTDRPDRLLARWRRRGRR